MFDLLLFWQIMFLINSSDIFVESSFRAQLVELEQQHDAYKLRNQELKSAVKNKDSEIVRLEKKITKMERAYDTMNRKNTSLERVKNTLEREVCFDDIKCIPLY